MATTAKSEAINRKRYGDKNAEENKEYQKEMARQIVQGERKKVGFWYGRLHKDDKITHDEWEQALKNRKREARQTNMFEEKEEDKNYER